MVFCYQNFSAHLWEKFVLFIDQEKVLKFDADGRELTKCLRSLEQSNSKSKQFLKQNAFLTILGGFLHLLWIKTI